MSGAGAPDGQLTPAKRSVGLLKCDACRRHTSCLPFHRLGDGTSCSRASVRPTCVSYSSLIKPALRLASLRPTQYRNGGFLEFRSPVQPRRKVALARKIGVIRHAAIVITAPPQIQSDPLESQVR